MQSEIYTFTSHAIRVTQNILGRRLLWGRRESLIIHSLCMKRHLQAVAAAMLILVHAGGKTWQEKIGHLTLLAFFMGKRLKRGCSAPIFHTS